MEQPVGQIRSHHLDAIRQYEATFERAPGDAAKGLPSARKEALAAAKVPVAERLGDAETAGRPRRRGNSGQ